MEAFGFREVEKAEILHFFVSLLSETNERRSRALLCSGLAASSSSSNERHARASADSAEKEMAI